MEDKIQGWDRFRESAPRIIQGGMGIAVSSWRLARRVAQLGEFGVVSATGIDTVMVRELQDGDPFGRIRALRAYPDQAIVDELIDRFYVPDGIGTDQPYKLLPIHRFKPTIQSQRILSAAAFSEVFLAREGHDGLVGINLLAKMKRYTLPGLYGAMLAGVDAVLMGAGIPIEEGEQIPLLAAGQPARLRLDVDTSQATEPQESLYYTLDPADLIPDPPRMARPMFFPIIASDSLANILSKKLEADLVTGWIIEGPVAGGHNAPPRRKQYDADQNPIYDERDIANLDRVADLGYPFYLAGGYGTPEKLQEALARGAQGIQVGSLFSLADESGYPAETKRRLIQQIHEGRAVIRTDGRISSTGFPFKVVEIEGTLGKPETYEERIRICDLGYLQQAYVDGRNKLQVFCPAEPVHTYVAKGGKEEDTVRRGCLCNGLMANIGLGQLQKSGREKPLFTAGDDLMNMPLGSAEHPSYSAEDVIRYLQLLSPRPLPDGSPNTQGYALG
jgi:NAD(P)H-dependent flavin oxidoreductase YrpB (nitropropane dioxygenase family)